MSSSVHQLTSQNDANVQARATGSTTHTALSATPHAASVSVSARRRGRPRLTEAQKAERKRRHAEAMRRKRRENSQLLAEQSEAKRQRQWSLYGSAVQVHGSGHAAQPCSSTSAGGTFMSSSTPQLTSQSDGNVQARATGCTTQTTLSAEGSGPCLSVATGDTFSSTSKQTSLNDVEFQGQPTGCTTLSTLSAAPHAASVSVSARRRGRPCLTEAQNAERKRRHAEAMRRKRRENPQLLADQIEKKRQRRNADPEFRAREAMWRKRKEHSERNVKKVEVNRHEGALLRARKAVMKRRRRDIDPQLRAREADHKRQRRQNDAELRALEAEAKRRHRQDNPHTAAREAEERRQQRQENPDLRSCEAEARRLWRRAEAEKTAWERLGQHATCRGPRALYLRIDKLGTKAEDNAFHAATPDQVLEEHSYAFKYHATIYASVGPIHSPPKGHGNSGIPKGLQQGSPVPASCSMPFVWSSNRSMNLDKLFCVTFWRALQETGRHWTSLTTANVSQQKTALNCSLHQGLDRLLVKQQGAAASSHDSAAACLTDSTLGVTARPTFLHIWRCHLNRSPGV